ncbi:MAG TPA: hypothetical protein VFO49_14525 [Nocardioides sp.]|nr:hypothetical protein [Nocardioides sp.]
MADDTELDRLMREGLEARAGEVDVRVPVAQRATAAVRRRHRRGMVVGFAAASVAAVVVVAALGSTPPAPEDSDDVPAIDTREWRTEYWADIQVDVPASWEWGGAPVGSGARRSVCSEVTDAPYVGRPVAQTDVCGVYQVDAPTVPPAPYVWLGVPLEPGTVDLGDGWTQETVRVGESAVTVATDDADLRNRILGSAREASLCPARMSEPPEPRSETTEEGGGDLISATVCAYQAEGDGFRLVYGSDLDTERAQGAIAAADAAARNDTRCKATSEFAVLSVAFSDDSAGSTEPRRLYQDLVYDLTCQHVRTGAAPLGAVRQVDLTADTVAPWAVGGVPGTLYGPSTQWSYYFFIGAQG